MNAPVVGIDASPGAAANVEIVKRSIWREPSASQSYPLRVPKVLPVTMVVVCPVELIVPNGYSRGR